MSVSRALSISQVLRARSESRALVRLIFCHTLDRMARHAKVHKVPAPLALTCEAIDAKCPGWRFSNTGGAQCRPGLHQSPKLLSQIFHHSEQQTFPLNVMYGDRPYAMVVESACFEGRRRRDPARCPANYSAYVAGLGVDARDRRRHPWQARAAILGTR